MTTGNSPIELNRDATNGVNSGSVDEERSLIPSPEFADRLGRIKLILNKIKNDWLQKYRSQRTGLRPASGDRVNDALVIASFSKGLEGLSGGADDYVALQTLIDEFVNSIYSQPIIKESSENLASMNTLIELSVDPKKASPEKQSRDNIAKFEQNFAAFLKRLSFDTAQVRKTDHKSLAQKLLDRGLLLSRRIAFCYHNQSNADLFWQDLQWYISDLLKLNLVPKKLLSEKLYPHLGILESCALLLDPQLPSKKE